MEVCGCVFGVVLECDYLGEGWVYFCWVLVDVWGYWEDGICKNLMLVSFLNVECIVGFLMIVLEFVVGLEGFVKWVEVCMS